MLIRKATMADLDSIANVESVCFPPSEAASKNAFEKRLKVFLDGFLVMEENGEIIGFINGIVTNSRVLCDEMFTDTTHHKHNGDYQTITSLAVIPEYREKGVAQQLMNEFIIRTRKRGRKGLILTCKEHLIDFYKTFGYTNSGISESKHGGAVWYDMILEF